MAKEKKETLAYAEAIAEIEKIPRPLSAACMRWIVGQPSPAE